jgi:predicted RND superfamily exporter protein
MFVTAVMLAIGFLVIALSGFATLREFGVLSAVTMSICLVSDVLLLPALVTKSKA